MAMAQQRSFDDLGTPLIDVTFCVIDLETTGGAAADGGITELGAVKLRGGECLGTFQTLVNPGCAVPPQITMLTGITEAMVMPAPRIEHVLPTLLEFLGDAVIVGHNVRYDLSFLGAALERAGHPPLRNRSIDTLPLARRLVRDEVPDCKLGTLAAHLRLDHRPSHRALDDALATGDLLHLLLERAGGLGVKGLDDLLGLPKMAGHAQAAKLKLTADLPRAPGVYQFRDRGGRVLYVGKATDLRARVRSYFSTDTRRKVGQLLRETHSIHHEVCLSPLDAAVREVRLIHELQPRFNRQAKTWGRYAYLKLTLHEPFPRLSVVRTPRDDGDFYLGPLPSSAFATRVAEAIESVVPLRRCTARLSRAGGTREAPCAAAQLGVATCPCAGTITAEAYDLLVARALRGLTTDPDLLLAPLRARMQALAAAERFEEAADVRARSAALALALRRQRRTDALRRAGRLVIDLPGGGAEVVDGRLHRTWSTAAATPVPGNGGPGGGPGDRGTDPGDGRLPLPDHGRTVLTLVPAADDRPTQPTLPVPGAALAPVSREQADEVACIVSYLETKGHHVRIAHCENGWHSPLPGLPSFEPRQAARTERPAAPGELAPRPAGSRPDRAAPPADPRRSPGSRTSGPPARSPAPRAGRADRRGRRAAS